MRRRVFIVGIGGAVAWPVVTRAQQRTKPVIGYLESGPVGLILEEAFRNGLSEMGYIEGQNVMIEYRFADGNFDRLPELAADLVRRQVTVIATPGSTPASLAAKAASTTIPIVFGVATDPVQTGLVSKFNRPGGNVTGFSEMNTEIGSKRFEFLHKLVPQEGRFGVLF